MAFNVKTRGKLTYYYEGDDPVLSSLVVEAQPDGDLRICFAGLTGGYSASGILGLETVTSMQPEIEIPLVFQCWEKWLQDAGFEIARESNILRQNADDHTLPIDDPRLGRATDQFLFIARKPAK